MRRKTKKYNLRVRLVLRAALALFFYLFAISQDASAVSLQNIYYSPDKRVKLIIPEGALSPAVGASRDKSLSASLPNPGGISVKSLSSQDISLSSLPKEAKFLIGAEFKPERTVFKKDCLLIFILPQAEIPGTPIQLYYYNAKAKKFIPEGSPCAVAKDGYSISFKIRHFLLAIIKTRPKIITVAQLKLENIVELA